VLKNNQPTALVISLDNYRELVDKASKLEILLDKIEEARLAGVADDRTAKNDNSTDFDDVLSEFGFSHDDIFSNLDSVEID
jgi:cupin superfamily acireductone dioxygenase involved in methionine salvage